MISMLNTHKTLAKTSKCIIKSKSRRTCTPKLTFTPVQRGTNVCANNLYENSCFCHRASRVYGCHSAISSGPPRTLTSTRLVSSFAGFGVCNVASTESFQILPTCLTPRQYCVRYRTVMSRPMVTRNFHVSSCFRDKEPEKASSKIEETVNLLKDKVKKEDKKQEVVVTPKKPLTTRIIEELKHYYHGFRLLFIDINISRKLAMKAIRGNTLTRREHRLLIRTVGDIFRLVPFSVFIIVPFMEFLLPVFIKFFPGMLPSTFETDSEKENKMKKSLKVKLEMAKFLQKTLDEMAVQTQDSGHKSDAAREFAKFYERVRDTGEPISNAEILKFSKLFEDEITLDSLSRPQLIALCRVLEIRPIGTSNFLAFQLRMKLRSLAADDKLIQSEGVDMLTIPELQQACRARGMRAYGMSEQRLKNQLQQWLDLSLNEKVPPSLLLLSRALLLPETIPTGDQLKATLSSLPDTVITQTKAVIGEREGKTDNLTRIEVLKEEQRRIQEELQERKEEIERKTKEEKELLADTAKVLQDVAPSLDKFADPTLIQQPTADKAKPEAVPEITASDIESLEDALDKISKKSLLVEKEELQDLKEELADYQEDVQDLHEVVQKAASTGVKVKESVGARRLFGKVNKMIAKMDRALLDLEKRKEKEKKVIEQQAPEEREKVVEEMVRIDELIALIRQIQKVPDGRAERLTEALAKLDDDKDGAISVEDIMKMIELIGHEDNVKLTPHQLDELALLLKREEQLLVEEQIQRALEKQTEQHKEEPEETKPVPAQVRSPLMPHRVPRPAENVKKQKNK